MSFRAQVWKLERFSRFRSFGVFIIGHQCTNAIISNLDVSLVTARAV